MFGGEVFQHHGMAVLLPVVTDSSVRERRERRPAAAGDPHDKTQGQRRQWISPLKTTSELWLSRVGLRPNALVIILSEKDRERGKRTVVTCQVATIDGTERSNEIRTIITLKHYHIQENKQFDTRHSNGMKDRF